MKKAVLVGINAKFVHSNLAIRSIYEYTRQLLQSSKQSDQELLICEYSINQDIEYILGQLAQLRPKTIGFSCYLWNIEIIRKLSRSIKLLFPDCTILYGGPEVSYTAESELLENPYVDYILCGEGEATFAALNAYLHGDGALPDYGIAYRTDSRIIIKPTGAGLAMDELPFPYASGFEELENRILYYETSRGCPFNCQYCLSSIEKGVRFKSLDKVYSELDVFLTRKVRQVKFVDRTFNAKPEHAIGIMEYLIAHDNGTTNFHFEVAPELVNDIFIQTLKKARQGLFQLEMGVQSTNPETLKIIKRYNQLDKITYAAQAIQKLQNTHIHMDLIAGLPEEGFVRFGESFDFVYDLQPDQLQLGFLKILKGSGMIAMTDTYKIQYRDYAPYEVLTTHRLTYEEIETLKLIEEMVELFYNSGLFLKVIKSLIKRYKSPFMGFHRLADVWKQEGMHHKKHQKLNLYEFLYAFIHLDFCNEPSVVEDLVQRLAFDYCLNEKPKKSLPWMNYQYIDPQTQLFLLETIESSGHWLSESSQFTTKQLSRMYHIDTWKSNATEFNGIQCKAVIKTEHETIEGEYLVINYEHRNFIDHSGEVIFIQIQRRNS